MTAKGIVYIAVFITEALSARLYFDYIYTPVKGRTHLFVSFLFGYILLYMAALLDNMFLNIALFFIVNATLLKTNYSCTIISSILHSAFLTAVMGITEIIVNLFIAYITHDFRSFTYSISAFVPLAVLSKTLYFLITIVAARLFKPHKDSYDEPAQIILLCIVPVSSLVIEVSYICIGLEGKLSVTAEVLVQISTILLLLMNLAVLFVYNRIQAIDHKNAALQMVQMRDQADAEYYKMLQEQYDAQRILIHDIKKHCNAIDIMAAEGNSDKIREYIAELETLPEFKNKVRLCNDPVLNMILLRYMDYSSSNGINFTCDIRADSVSFMDAVSITALFGNLVSNAVEAAEKSGEKRVEISVIKNQEQQNVLISAVNSCDTEPVKDADGNPKTVKGENAGHGYGTKSIARVVKRYNGKSSTYYDRELKEFHSIIVLPIQAL